MVALGQSSRVCLRTRWERMGATDDSGARVTPPISVSMLHPQYPRPHLWDGYGAQG